MSASDEESPLVSESITEPMSESRSRWDRYCDLVEERPLLIKGMSAFVILGLGDLSAQGVEYMGGASEGHGVDWVRSFRFGCFGLIGAPWAHYYFYYLDKYLPPTEKPCSWTTLLKLLIDQGIQAPTMLALIIITLSILKGEGVRGAKLDMRESYMDALYANWKLWVPASLFNLAFVAPSLRVLYVNVIFFIWTIILSMMLNSSS